MLREHDLDHRAAAASLVLLSVDVFLPLPGPLVVDLGRFSVFRPVLHIASQMEVFMRKCCQSATRM